MERLEVRLRALPRDALARLVAVIIENIGSYTKMVPHRHPTTRLEQKKFTTRERKKALAVAEAAIAEETPLAAWAVDGVLLSADLLSRIFCSLDKKDHASARACTVWRGAWRVGRARAMSLSLAVQELQRSS